MGASSRVLPSAFLVGEIVSKIDFRLASRARSCDTGFVYAGKVEASWVLEPDSVSQGSKHTLLSFVRSFPLTLELPFLYARLCVCGLVEDQCTRELLVGNETRSAGRRPGRNLVCWATEVSVFWLS